MTARRVRTTRELSPSQAPKYLSKAREFLAAAQFSLELENNTAATSNSVHAGVNAGDAISCALVGSVSKGEHADRQNISRRSGMRRVRVICASSYRSRHRPNTTRLQ